MQPTPAGGRTGSGGGVGSGGEPSDGGGLARFRSAPATWLDALLDEEEEDLLKPNQCFTQLLSNNLDIPTSQKSVSFGSSTDQDLFQLGSSDGFLRQNSSPAVFLANGGIGSDGFFLNTGISASNGFPAANIEVSPTASKRAREAKFRNIPPKFSAQKEEPIDEVLGGVSSSIDMEIDKLMEDSVPCRVRAKRGCATHPRSIAERVRRTRISDRIRKLQELVPNMDRQTNTADMLEEAVEYVKYLQKQIQELSEHQRRCTCMGKAD